MAGRCPGIVALCVSLGLATEAAAAVVIHEIHYAPADKTVREEFVELHNSGPDAVDLSGWRLTGGVGCRIPDGTVLEPGGFLVVAQDPDALVSLHGEMPVVGPFEGRLGNDGEELVLRAPDGRRQDSVDYGLGFPWPTAGGPDGFSIELIHPDLDNELGGSWRLSTSGSAGRTTLVAAGSRWKYLEGTSEASNPVEAWRAAEFGDAGWMEGDLPIGYGEGFLSTVLDMRDRYACVFLRKEFDVADPSAVGSLVLEAQYDDGFNAWINGTHVATSNMASTSPTYDASALSALENAEFQEFRLPRPVTYLVPGRNVLAIQLHNSSIGGSSDAFVDARLIASSGGGSGPTPGAPNSVFSATAPPQLRQVQHLPERPFSGSSVVVEVKATDPDGVSRVTLEYQTVDPGAYTRLEDPGYATGWTALEMHDDGAAGDALAGDDVWSVLVPAAVQVHRRLVRYRISAADGPGSTVTAPYPDDPQPNFAYFVHDGVPPWRGASRPGTTPVREFGSEVLESLPVYHLIAREQDVINSQYVSSYENVHFHGTLVYEGTVLDHIEFENRGEFSTYVSGKNKWRFHFQRGHDFPARDAFGRPYRRGWRKMNFSAAASPWVPTNRGMAGLDEAAGFRLYELAGVPSPRTGFVHFRIVDEATETHATDQYRGDLWGLYLTIEHTDGRFLDERGLPDGNTYKIENGSGDKRNQGPTQSVDSSDYNALRNGYNQSQPISWWRANVDLFGYWGFRAVGRAINDMDLREGWNVCQYHDPVTNLWSVMPWDLDMLYMPVTHWSGVMNFQNAVTQHQALRLEFQSRCRELIDLLFTPDQLAQVVEELAAAENPPGWTLTMVDVDEAMWNWHPRTASDHKGAFYRNPSTHGAIGGTIQRTLVSADHEGMARWIEDFVLSGYGFQQLAADAADSAIPERPTIEDAGDPGHPIDGIVLRAGPFRDPQGGGTFGGMKWRLAEIAPDGAPPYVPLSPRPYEVEPVWESEELPAYQDTIGIPPEAVPIGARCRARVRFKDATGRWSRWSLPAEFTTSPPRDPDPAADGLRITEIMYHPGEPDLEFIELQNIGDEPLDLTHAALTNGIEFRFGDGEVTSLAPGEMVLVVADRFAFEGAHDTTGMRIAGEYSGKLDNGGEEVCLVWGRNLAILDFAYSDEWYPETDGLGRSLVIADPLAPASSWALASSWGPSAFPGGSPGFPEGSMPRTGSQRPGDATQDGAVDIADAVSILVRLFVDPGTPPCDGAIGEGGNAILLDVDGNGSVEVGDPIHLLRWLFASGPAPSRGPECIRISGCPEVCEP